MPEPPETVLTLVRGAAQGDPRCRSLFCGRYLPLVRAYLAARWGGTPWTGQVDDGVQEVFLECLRERGALDVFEPGRAGGFRPFLYAVTRNVARRIEQAQGRRTARERVAGEEHLRGRESGEASLTLLFDREWARTVMQHAREGMQARASLAGDDALRRIELLRLRFEEGLPIRAIAARWQQDPAATHRAYRKAREEFREALEEAVAYHCAGAPEEVLQECARLLGLLGS